MTCRKLVMVGPGFNSFQSMSDMEKKLKRFVTDILLFHWKCHRHFKMHSLIVFKKKNHTPIHLSYRVTVFKHHWSDHKFQKPVSLDSIHLFIPVDLDLNMGITCIKTKFTDIVFIWHYRFAMEYLPGALCVVPEHTF